MAVKLKADKRDELKKSYTKQLRQEGFIPGIVYGKDKQPKTISVNSMDLLKTVRDEGRNAIISLDVDGESVDVMLHDFQTDPLKDELLHADFYVVNMSQEMDVEVPVHIEGEAQGVKDGGVLQQPLYNLAIRAKPADIPEYIEVDVSHLEIGDSITVGDLKTSKAYEITEEVNTVIVGIIPPETEVEEEKADSAEDEAGAESTTDDGAGEEQTEENE